MSNVVQFLEALARNPKRLSAEDYAALIIAAGLDPTSERALLANDVRALNQGLNARSVIACLIFPAEDEPNDGQEQEQEGEEEAPDQENSALAA